MTTPLVTDDDLEVVRGSGNIFADFGHPHADQEQLRAILAAEIIRTLDAENLTVRAAQERTGFAAADFSRIRNVRLERFTLDRLMSILEKLDRDVQMSVSFQPRRTDGLGAVQLV
jgi:predicted XRE-type DNA-binding protein